MLYDVSHFGDWLANGKGPYVPKVDSREKRCNSKRRWLHTYVRSIQTLEIWRSGLADAEELADSFLIQAMSPFLILQAASPHNHRLADAEWKNTLLRSIGRTWMVFSLTEGASQEPR